MVKKKNMKQQFPCDLKVGEFKIGGVIFPEKRVAEKIRLLAETALRNQGVKSSFDDYIIPKYFTDEDQGRALVPLFYYYIARILNEQKKRRFNKI